MNTTKMLDRAVSKGHNAIEAAELLNELIATYKGANLAFALHYNSFISTGQAEKMSVA